MPSMLVPPADPVPGLSTTSQLLEEGGGGLAETACLIIQGTNQVQCAPR